MNRRCRAFIQCVIGEMISFSPSFYCLKEKTNGQSQYLKKKEHLIGLPLPVLYMTDRMTNILPETIKS